MNDILLMLLSALLGGSGMVGIATYNNKKYIDRKFAEEDAKTKEVHAYKVQKAKCDERIQHAQGRMFFWLNRAIVTGTHNGELEAAMKELDAAEAEKKDLEREIVVKFEQSDE